MKNDAGVPTSHTDGRFPGTLDGRYVRITSISDERWADLLEQPDAKVHGPCILEGGVYPVLATMRSGIPADVQLMILDRYSDEFCLCVRAADGGPLPEDFATCHLGVSFQWVIGPGKPGTEDCETHPEIWARAPRSPRPDVQLDLTRQQAGRLYTVIYSAPKLAAKVRDYLPSLPASEQTATEMGKLISATAANVEDVRQDLGGRIGTYDLAGCIPPRGAM